MSFSEKYGDVKAQFLALMDEVGSVTEVARQVGVNWNTAYGWARQAGLSSQRLGGRRRPDYLQLRQQGITQVEAAMRVAVIIRTARDWDYVVRRSRDSRFYPDGRRVNSATGKTTMESMKTPLAALCPSIPDSVSTRLLSLLEREKIADLRRGGLSMRVIGRELGRSASTVMRELEAHTLNGRYLPHGAHRDAAAARARPKVVKLAQPGRHRD